MKYARKKYQELERLIRSRYRYRITVSSSIQLSVGFNFYNSSSVMVTLPFGQTWSSSVQSTVQSTWDLFGINGVAAEKHVSCLSER